MVPHQYHLTNDILIHPNLNIKITVVCAVLPLSTCFFGGIHLQCNFVAFSVLLYFILFILCLLDLYIYIYIYVYILSPSFSQYNIVSFVPLLLSSTLRLYIYCMTMVLVYKASN